MKTGLPDSLDLDANYVIQFTALTATTGAVDTSVVVSNASLLVENVVGGDLTSPPTDISPLWIPVPASDIPTDSGG